MNYVGDEVITVAAGQTKTLTRASIDNASGPRATVAFIFNHNIENATVGYRLGSAPVEADYTFIEIAPGDKLVLEGYDNLINVQFILVGSETAKLFATYFR